MASLLFIAGAAAIVAGCALIYLPAGFIVAGAFGVLIGWLLERARGDA